MLPSSSRSLAQLATLRHTTGRRFFSDHLSSSPPVAANKPTSNATLPQTSQAPPIQPRRRGLDLRQGRSGGFYLMIMGLSLLTVPPIAYYYWEHRKAHMKAKKEAMLRDIQARVAAQ